MAWVHKDIFRINFLKTIDENKDYGNTYGDIITVYNTVSDSGDVNTNNIHKI